MSSDILIEAHGLGKFYPKKLSMRQLLRYLAPWPQNHSQADFWALRNFDFTLKRGEVVGLLGRNGSGKSTFLQLVAGLLEPSQGQILVNGTSAALLELGAGFNPEFSGRENIYLSGRIYGYSRDRIDALLDPILSFADIGEHIDQPVKTYSSGMFARLAFAIAIRVEPDILLVDEILSVGDLGFQAKCFRRIEEIKAQGTSILFVSHDLNTMQMLCDRLVLLDNGQKIAEGEPREIARIYTERISRRAYDTAADIATPTNAQPPQAIIHNTRLIDMHGQDTHHPVVGERYSIVFSVEWLTPICEPIVSVQFMTMAGLIVADVNNLMMRERLPDAATGDRYEVTFNWVCNFCPGPYRIGIGLAETTDDIPLPIAGFEAFAVEITSDRPTYGITHIEPELLIRCQSAI
jgi:ABC-type polysaccharide/polyol phosphate transport system ATPase subunit